MNGLSPSARLDGKCGSQTPASTADEVQSMRLPTQDQRNGGKYADGQHRRDNQLRGAGPDSD
jgi:hypothetical protein